MVSMGGTHYTSTTSSNTHTKVAELQQRCSPDHSVGVFRVNMTGFWRFYFPIDRGWCQDVLSALQFQGKFRPADVSGPHHSYSTLPPGLQWISSAEVRSRELLLSPRMDRRGAYRFLTRVRNPVLAHWMSSATRNGAFWAFPCYREVVSRSWKYVSACPERNPG